MTPLQSAPHFAELFDYLDDVLAWVKDQEGRYVWVNRAMRINYSLEHAAEDGSAAGLGPGAEPTVLGKTDYDLSLAFLADQFRIPLVGPVRRQHVIVGGDDAEIDRRRAGKTLLVIGRAGGKAMGEIGAGQAVAGWAGLADRLACLFYPVEIGGAAGPAASLDTLGDVGDDGANGHVRLFSCSNPSE